MGTTISIVKITNRKLRFKGLGFVFETGIRQIMIGEKDGTKK